MDEDHGVYLMSADTSELHRISDVLSPMGDDFPVSNLVSYGRTIIVKPGAKMASGRLVTGQQVMEALSADYDVFPLAVTYRPDVMKGVTEIEREMDALGAELDAMGGEDDEFGATPWQSKRMRRRYQKIVASYRRYATLALQPGRKRAVQISQRLFAKLTKLWGRMQAKGVSTADLPSPQQVRIQLSSAAPVVRRVVATKVRPMSAAAPIQAVQAPVYEEQVEYPVVQQAPAPAPMARRKQPVSDLYFQDQAALERELEAVLPKAFGAEEAHRDMISDLRAETHGWKFGALEHDYWGLQGSEVELIFSDPRDKATIGPLHFDQDEEAIYGAEDERVSDVEDRLTEERPLDDVEAKEVAKVRSKAVSAVEEDEGGGGRGGVFETATSAAELALPVVSSLAKGEKKLPRAVRSLSQTAQDLLPFIREIGDRFGEESAHGGVHYGRVVPAKPGAGGEPILVIAIRSRRFGTPRGPRGAKSKVMASLGADISTFRRPLPSSLSPLEAMSLYQSHVDPEDMFYGSTNRWPFGEEAPLPPPRRNGPEVHA